MLKHRVWAEIGIPYTQFPNLLADFSLTYLIPDFLIYTSGWLSSISKAGMFIIDQLWNRITFDQKLWRYIVFLQKAAEIQR